MNAWQLGLLIWALVVAVGCLFIYGANVTHKDTKAQRDAEYRRAWAERLSAKYLQ
jgi:hypothetical protein